MSHNQEVDQTEAHEKDSLLSPLICYRDLADVRNIRRQSRLLLLALFVTATAVVGVGYKSIQRPDRIVVDRSSGRTVMINNRELGATEAVRLEKDKLQVADMDYVVNDGPRYISPGDPEMVTVDEKALDRNKRAIIVRPGSLFVVPALNQRKRTPAATVTAQMRSGLVVTFLFYPVADLAQNVHRCVLSYQRDGVVARRRAAGLPVNLDQKEQGGEKPTEQSGAPASISVEPAEQAKAIDDTPSNHANAFRKLRTRRRPQR